MQKRLNKKPHKSWGKWILLLLLLFFLFLLLWFFFGRKPEQDRIKKTSSTDTALVAVQAEDSSLSDPDSTGPVPDSSVSPPADADTVTQIKTKKSASPPPRSLTPDHPKSDTLIEPDTIRKDTAADSSAVKSGSDTLVPVADPCNDDTTALWVYPDPSGGLHRKAISLSMVSSRSCDINYRFSGEEEWIVWHGETIDIRATTTLQFKATDSCGRQMEMREEYYEIEILDTESPCPRGMELVSVGDLKFCIDRYEWPNRKGVLPQSYISIYQAMDSCYAVGKRLCTSEEWMLACGGPHTWAYPYGQVYEKYACATHDNKVSASGSRPECRSFFGTYDMSGSLLEWTSTKAVNNRQFYYVMGGFWESGPQSGCAEKRYSYFPENQHNPVGFRCCAGLPDQSESGAKKVQKRSGR